MVKEYFLCEYRGKLPVKYKGNIDMYFVNGLRPELSVDLKGIPNKRFFTKLQLLRLGDLEEKVFEGILNDLPANLLFSQDGVCTESIQPVFSSLSCRRNGTGRTIACAYSCVASIYRPYPIV